jgi:hypothetical protein
MTSRFDSRIFVGIALFWAIIAPTTVRASSAVAVAVNSKGGLGYGYYHDHEITEAEARRRAIKQCLIWGGQNPRIIASTSKRGYGAVIWFLRTDKKLDYTAALAAKTWDAALNQAKKQAKDLGEPVSNSLGDGMMYLPINVSRQRCRNCSLNLRRGRCDDFKQRPSM